MTMYPMDYLNKLPPMGDHTGTAYAMAHGIGRSYRYYTGKPLFAFGAGLSLTTWNFTCNPAARAAAGGGSGDDDTPPTYRRLEYFCTVHNTGSLDGDEVLQVYHRVGPAIRAQAAKLHPVPLKQLVAFERLSGVKAGGSASVAFSMEPTVLALTTANGSKAVYPGAHELVFSTGDAAPDVTMLVTV